MTLAAAGLAIYLSLCAIAVLVLGLARLVSIRPIKETP